MTQGGDHTHSGSRRLWVILSAALVLIIAWGLITFKLVGDRHEPGWDFGSVPFEPGKSTYSTRPATPGPLGGGE